MSDSDRPSVPTRHGKVNIVQLCWFGRAEALERHSGACSDAVVRTSLIRTKRI